MLLIFKPLSHIPCAISMIIEPFPMRLVILPIALIHVPISMYQPPPPIRRIALPVAFIERSVLPILLPLSVSIYILYYNTIPLTLFPLTFVYCASILELVVLQEGKRLVFEFLVIDELAHLLEGGVGGGIVVDRKFAYLFCYVAWGDVVLIIWVSCIFAGVSLGVIVWLGSFSE
jgi:hypothetical protein